LYILIRILSNCIAQLHHSKVQQKDKLQTEFINFKTSSFSKMSGNCTNEPLKYVVSLLPYLRLMTVNEFS